MKTHWIVSLIVALAGSGFTHIAQSQDKAAEPEYIPGNYEEYTLSMTRRETKAMLQSQKNIEAFEKEIRSLSREMFWDARERELGFTVAVSTPVFFALQRYLDLKYFPLAAKVPTKKAFVKVVLTTVSGYLMHNEAKAAYLVDLDSRDQMIALLEETRLQLTKTIAERQEWIAARQAELNRLTQMADNDRKIKP